MASRSVRISKFVGVATLGLLTGSALNLCLLTVPSLLALPTFPLANRAFSILRIDTTRYHRILTTLSASSLLLAYTLSPSVCRHPYLLWTVSVVVAGIGLQKFEEVGEAQRALAATKRNRVEVRAVDEIEDEEVNGEVVRETMVRWGEGMQTMVGVWGLGWVLGMIGLWGDGA